VFSFGREQEFERESGGAKAGDEGQVRAVVGGAGKEEVGNRLWYEAQRAILGRGEVETMKVRVQSDVASSKLR
jgi:hypothetical protein